MKNTPILCRTRSQRPPLACWKIIVTLLAVIAPPTIAADFDTEATQLTAAAQRAFEVKDYAGVEQRRMERWDLIKSEADSHPESVFSIGYAALTKVDGFEDGNGDTDIGLIDNLKYNECCVVLLAAWDEMTRVNPNGPVLGEVATRLFEVHHQAANLFPDTIDEKSPFFTPGADRLPEILSQAVELDPCATLARPMIEFLREHPTSEVFLRAEVRDSFKNAQANLNAVAHPLIRTASSGDQNGVSNSGNGFGADRVSQLCNGGVTGTQVANGSSQGQLQSSVMETGAGQPGSQRNVADKYTDAEVLPWHAPVEFVKARNLATLMKDLDYTEFLLGAWFNNATRQIVPTKVLRGFDSTGTPFEFMYGRLLVTSVTRGNGKRQSVVVMANQSGPRELLYLNIDLLWRVPTEQDLQQSPTAQAYNTELSKQIPKAEFSVGTTNYRIYNYPTHGTEQLLVNSTPIACVKDATKFSRLRDSRLNNNPQELGLLLARPGSTAPFYTSPAVIASAQNSARTNDRTKHPLNDLMESSDMLGTPLVLISPAKDKEVDLNFLYDDTGRPYLLLEDGKQLVFDLTDSAHAPQCLIELDAGTLHFPLNYKAIPHHIILGIPVGDAIKQVLEAAGYRSDQIIRELERAINDPTYFPDKLERFIRVAAASTDTLPLVMYYQKLAEYGWRNRGLTAQSPGDYTIPQIFEVLYYVYGYRYFVDARGNWVVNREIKELFASDNSQQQNDGTGQALTTSGSPAQGNRAGNGSGRPNTRGGAGSGGGQGQGPDLTDDQILYPFEYRAKDGLTLIDRNQTYSWCDYLKIKENIYSEHLSKVLTFHACLPALDLIEADADKELVHPANRIPEFLKLNASLADAASQQAEGSSGVGNIQTNSAMSVTGANVQMSEAASGASLFLDSPVPRWLVADDLVMQTTLNSLHAGYKQALVQSSVYKKTIADLSKSIREYKLIVSLLMSKSARASAERRLAILEGERERLEERFMEATRAVSHVQLESARDWARRGYHHKSLVWYNDLLAEIRPPDYTSFFEALLSKVPNAAKGQEFLAKVQRLIHAYKFLVSVQLELAGVLHKSGLNESAHVVFQRTVDDFDLFVAPAIDIAREYVESYGVRFDPATENVVESLRQRRELAAAAIKQFDVRSDWQQLSWLANDHRAARLADIKKIAIITSQQSEAARNRLAPQAKNQETLELDAALDRELRKPPSEMDFLVWLEQKKAFLARPAYVTASGDVSVHITAAVPFQYSPENGFSQDYVSLLEKTDAKTVALWARMPAADQAASPDASTSMFLLAWYWHDMDQEPRAREALASLARHANQLASAALDRGDTLESYVQQANAFVALATASAIGTSVPGVHGLRVTFSSALKIQTTMWERHWAAASLYSPHATTVRSEIDILLDFARMSAENDLERAAVDRWYFPDYLFKWPGVPDYLATKAFQTPDLFGPVTVELIATMGADAVVDPKKMQMQREEARNFMDRLPLNEEVDLDVLGVDVKKIEGFKPVEWAHVIPPPGQNQGGFGMSGMGSSFPGSYGSSPPPSGPPQRGSVPPGSSSQNYGSQPPSSSTPPASSGQASGSNEEASAP